MPTQPQRQRGDKGQNQQGAVLIIVLIMLALLSMVAVTNLRNTQSTESISGNTRNTELASQAADIALRHCEASVMKRMAINNNQAESEAAQYTSSFTDAHISNFVSPPAWQDAAGQWDTSNPYLFILPIGLLGNTALYKRASECLVMSLTATPANHFVITARGFGPEVAAAGAKRLRPVGTEIWLQTHVSLAEDFQTLKSRSWRQIFLR